MKALDGIYALSRKDRRPIKVGVKLSDFICEEHHQLSLFSDDRRLRAQRAVDRINEKFGRDTIYVGSLHDSLDKAPTLIAFARIPGLDELE